MTSDAVDHFADHDESVLAVIEGVAATDDAVWEHLATCGPCLAAVAKRSAETAIAVVRARGYALGRELARGGMGRVVLGHDAFLQREVAIKLALPEVGGAQRFQREIELTARLQHPNIVPVYDAGTLDGAEFYAMRPVRGQRLDERITAARTREQRTLLLPHVLAVVDAVAYAHEQGIIHRDLKPANVLVGEFGETVVIDWGLGKQVGTPDDAAGATAAVSDHDSTRVGAVIGTPGYMAPEQARGEATDARTDVFALGCILFETLTGARAYRGSGDERVAAAARGAALEMAKTGRDLPPELRAIVTKATAAAPAARYVNADALGADLRRYQAGLLVGAHRYRWHHRLARWFRRHRLLVAVVVGVLATGSVIGAVAVRRVVAERDRANLERQSADMLIGYLVETLPPKLRAVGKLDVLADAAVQLDAYYTRVVPARGTGAAELTHLAQVRMLRGATASSANDAAGAQALLQQAEELARRAERAGDVRARGVLARLAVERGSAAMTAGDDATATVALKQALELLNAEPLGAERTQLLGTTYARLAGIAGSANRLDELATYAKAARDVILTPAPGDDYSLQLLVALEQSEVTARLANHDTAGATEHADRGVALAEQLAKQSPWNPEAHAVLAQIRAVQAGLREDAGDHVGADAAYAVALDAGRVLCDLDPTNVQWLEAYAATLLDAADVREELAATSTALTVPADVLREEAVRRVEAALGAATTVGAQPVLVKLALLAVRGMATPESLARGAALAERLPPDERECAVIGLARDQSGLRWQAGDAGGALAALDLADAALARMVHPTAECAYSAFEITVDRAVVDAVNREALRVRARSFEEQYKAAGAAPGIVEALQQQLAKIPP